MGIGVDAEDGEVGIVTRPEPVVLVEAELRDLLGRIDHEADIVIALFEEHVVAIAAEEGDDARTYAGHLGEGARFEELFGQGGEHTGRLARVLIIFLLTREGFNAGGDIVDAHHEGEGQAGHGQLLGTALGEETILEIIVLEVAHGLHIREAAVIVGKDEAIGANYFACASAAEASDDIAKRRCVFAI